MEVGADGAQYAVKPKGMHRRTFERLLAEYQRVNAAEAALLAPVLERWHAGDERRLAELERYLRTRADEL